MLSDIPTSNIAVKRDWLTAGFARFQPAPYLKEALIKSRALESRLKPLLQNQWVAGADLVANRINQRFLKR